MVSKGSLTNQGLRKEKNWEVRREVCKGLGRKKGVQNGAPDCLVSENYGALYTAIVQVVSNKWNKPLFKPHTFQSLPQDAMGVM